VNERLYLGIEIGGTKLQVVLGNDHGDIIDCRRFSVTPAAGAEAIRGHIKQALAIFMSHHRLTAVGIGFGGPIDWRTGKAACSHHVEGWSDFELAAWIGDLARVPVAVDNDANTAALAEAVRGVGAGRNPVFYVTLGSGVGGGLVLDGAIYHGALPGEAEIGHIRLDKSGTVVEARCSGWAVDKRIREAVKSTPESKLKSLLENSTGAEARHLSVAIQGNDSLALRILDETAEDLAFALSHVTHLFHPEIIVIGGGLSLIGDPLRHAVERHLRRFIMKAFAPGPSVLIASLGEDVVPIGALLLAKMAGDRATR
jgi:glucokinase